MSVIAAIKYAQVAYKNKDSTTAKFVISSEGIQKRVYDSKGHYKGLETKYFKNAQDFSRTTWYYALCPGEGLCTLNHSGEHQKSLRACLIQ